MPLRTHVEKLGLEGIFQIVTTSLRENLGSSGYKAWRRFSLLKTSKLGFLVVSLSDGYLR